MNSGRGKKEAHKNLVKIANTAVRPFQAQITLDQMEIRDSNNLRGDVAALKKLRLFNTF